MEPWEERRGGRLRLLGNERKWNNSKRLILRPAVGRDTYREQFIVGGATYVRSVDILLSTYVRIYTYIVVKEMFNFNTIRSCYKLISSND